MPRLSSIWSKALLHLYSCTYLIYSTLSFFHFHLWVCRHFFFHLSTEKKIYGSIALLGHSLPAVPSRCGWTSNIKKLNTLVSVKLKTKCVVLEFLAIILLRTIRLYRKCTCTLYIFCYLGRCVFLPYALSVHQRLYTDAASSFKRTIIYFKRNLKCKINKHVWISYRHPYLPMLFTFSFSDTSLAWV